MIAIIMDLEKSTFITSVQTYGDIPQMYSFTLKLKTAEAIVDKTGAQDSFIGGFLAKLSKIENAANYHKESIVIHTKESLTDAIKAGNLMSTQVLTKIGCVFPS